METERLSKFIVHRSNSGATVLNRDSAGRWEIERNNYGWAVCIGEWDSDAHWQHIMYVQDDDTLTERVIDFLEESGEYVPSDVCEDFDCSHSYCTAQIADAHERVRIDASRLVYAMRTL